MTLSWIKLWARWYETMSHARLRPEALHTGPHLLVIAGKYGRREDGSAALVGPDGEPLRIVDLADMTRWTSKKMAEIVADLRKAGTLVAVGDTFVFPTFTRWQESSSASRMRRHRAVTVTDDVRLRDALRERREDRREKTEQPPPPDLEIVGRPGGSWGEVAAVCDRLPWLAPEGLPALLSPRDRIHKLVVAGATADEICEVIEGFGAAVLAGKEPRDRWNAQFVFSGHFDRLRMAYHGGPAAVVESAVDRLRRLEGGT